MKFANAAPKADPLARKFRRTTLGFCTWKMMPRKPQMKTRRLGFCFELG
jgi:hypothetical protein